MELGKNDLNGGHPLAVIEDFLVDRNAAAVVNDGDGVVDVDGDFDVRGVAGQGLDGVVDDFVDEMMESHFPRGADVHGRS